MFRFTIRELRLLIVIAGLALGWPINRADWVWRMRAVRRHAMALRDSLYNAEFDFVAVYNKVPAESDPVEDLLPVDWELASQMIP